MTIALRRSKSVCSSTARRVSKGFGFRYCKRVYLAQPDSKGSVFLTLLRIYLRPRPNMPVLLEPAVGLISRHASRIDATEVFELLPPLMTVQELQDFLVKAIRRSVELQRGSRVEREIYRARQDQLDLKLVTLEDKRVKITESRVCPQCNKRLGNSVLAIHAPEYVHLPCFAVGLVLSLPLSSGVTTHYQCRQAFIESRSQGPY
jgi:hypothetical protein